MRRISLIVAAALTMGSASISGTAHAQVVYMQCGYGAEYLGCGGGYGSPLTRINPVGIGLQQAAQMQELQAQQMEMANAQLQNQILRNQIQMQQRLLDAPGGNGSNCVANYLGTGFKHCF